VEPKEKQDKTKQIVEKGEKIKLERKKSSK
jgi:hypothetical protein